MQLKIICGKHQPEISSDKESNAQDSASDRVNAGLNFNQRKLMSTALDHIPHLSMT